MTYTKDNCVITFVDDKTAIKIEPCPGFTLMMDVDEENMMVVSGFVIIPVTSIDTMFDKYISVETEPEIESETKIDVV